MNYSRLAGSAVLAAALVLFSSAGAPSAAEAQAPAGDQVEASPKGLVGLGLIGAEIGFIVPAVAGLHETWAFIVFPIVGAAGGAVAGHFLLDANDLTEWSIVTLAVGMAMVVPTMVITLSATAYDPEDEMQLPDEAGGDEETLDDAAVPGEEEAAPQSNARQRHLARAGGGLLRFAGDELVLTAPAIEIAQSLTPAERLRFGGESATELHVPVVSGAF